MLQQALEASLKEHFGTLAEEIVAAKRGGIVIVDVTELRKPRVASLNGELMMYAASLPKIAIVFGALKLVERNELTLDSSLRESLVKTIRVSSNRDATSVLDQVGFERLAGILTSKRYGLYDPDHGGGLWVGRGYGGGKDWKRDPINEISHGASAMSVARLYYLLLTGRLLSPEMTAEMLEALSSPGVEHKFVKGLKQRRPDARIYRKSGTWKEFHADSGIIDDENSRYIAVAVGQHPKGGEGMAQLIIAIDDAVERAKPGR